jgi:hypothetical protein
MRLHPVSVSVVLMLLSTGASGQGNDCCSARCVEQTSSGPDCAPPCRGLPACPPVLQGIYFFHDSNLPWVNVGLRWTYMDTMPWQYRLWACRGAGCTPAQQEQKCAPHTAHPPRCTGSQLVWLYGGPSCRGTNECQGWYRKVRPPAGEQWRYAISVTYNARDPVPTESVRSNVVEPVWVPRNRMFWPDPFPTTEAPGPPRLEGLEVLL